MFNDCRLCGAPVVRSRRRVCAGCWAARPSWKLCLQALERVRAEAGHNCCLHYVVGGDVADHSVDPGLPWVKSEHPACQQALEVFSRASRTARLKAGNQPRPARMVG